jgi:hypothetical protein
MLNFGSMYEGSPVKILKIFQLEITSQYIVSVLNQVININMGLKICNRCVNANIILYHNFHVHTNWDN